MELALIPRVGVPLYEQQTHQYNTFEMTDKPYLKAWTRGRWVEKGVHCSIQGLVFL